MKHNRLKLKIVMVMIFVLAYGLVYYYNTTEYNERVNAILQEEIKDLEVHYFHALERFKTDARVSSKFMFTNLNTLELFARVKGSTEEEQSRIRKEMYDLLLPTYKRISTRGVSNITFVLPDNRVFLRMHKPEKFGDDLTDIRYTYNYIHKTHQPISGFEQGRKHAFRYAYPLFDKDKNYLGASEIGFSSDYIQDLLFNSFDIENHFLIHKKLFDAKSWPDDEILLHNYRPSFESRDYVFVETPMEGMDHKEHKAILSSLENDIDANMALKKEFVLYKILHDNAKVITFLPITNIQGEEGAAYLVSYTDHINIYNINRDYIIVNLMIFVGLMAIFIFIYRSLQQKELLKSEVDKQTKKIKEQKQIFETIYHKSTDGVFLMKEGKFIDCNESVLKMFNYKNRDEILKLQPSELSALFQPDGRDSSEKTEEMLKIAIEKGSNQFEWLNKKSNGEMFWAEIVLTDISTTEDPDMLHVVFRDIDDRKKVEKEIEELNCTLELRVRQKTDALREKDEIMLAQSRLAAMGDMISMIAHQWRQPITAIGVGAQNMQLDIELGEIDPERFDTKLAKIVEQTHFLSRTIDDFRDFLKPNKLAQPCRLSNMLEDALSIIGKSLESSNIVLNRSYEKDVEIMTFNTEVIQILLNIINNARDVITIKEIGDGAIWLSIGQNEEMAYFKICDNAGGIPDDILPRIFEPYFSTKESKGGTGLGLYMSQMIAEKHLNGTITAENIKGEGACFTLSLPLQPRLT